MSSHLNVDVGPAHRHAHNNNEHLYCHSAPRCPPMGHAQIMTSLKHALPLPRQTENDYHETRTPALQPDNRLLQFCNLVLGYEDSKAYLHDEEAVVFRSRHNTSPLGSTGSTEGCSSSAESANANASAEEDRILWQQQKNKQTHLHESGEDEITCYCGRPYGGLLMVECSHCSIWVHSECEGITNKKLPKDYFCTRCQKKLRVSYSGKRLNRKRSLSRCEDEVKMSRSRKGSLNFD